MTLVTGTCLALEFSEHDTTSERFNGVAAVGEIVPGDAVRLGHYLDNLPTKANTGVYLASPGGDLYEGMKLGRLFRKRRLKTIVEGGQTCASACALAFLGGVDKRGRRWMSSTTTSRLGFHAFRNSDGTTMADTDVTQAVVADILTYADEVQAPRPILIRAFGTPARTVAWLGAEELLGLGIQVWDMERCCFLPCARNRPVVRGSCPKR
jgi:hypothetical protein